MSGGLTPDEPAGRPARWRVAIPTAVTLGNALSGFAAVAVLSGAVPMSFEQSIAVGGWLILVAWVCDMTDGMIARMVGASGRFGAALDSLCDVVGFGVAPAFMVGVLGAAYGVPWWAAWPAGALLLAGVLIRLARFDAEDAGADDGPEGHLWFRGLPSPVVGASVAAVALCWAEAAFGGGAMRWLTPAQQDALVWALSGVLPVVAVVVAALAVSTLRYPDLPKHYLKNIAPRWHLIMLALAMIALGPGVGLLAFFLAYVALGPLAGRRAAAAGPAA